MTKVIIFNCKLFSPINFLNSFSRHMHVIVSAYSWNSCSVSWLQSKITAKARSNFLLFNFLFYRNIFGYLFDLFASYNEINNRTWWQNCYNSIELQWTSVENITIANWLLSHSDRNKVGCCQSNHQPYFTTTGKFRWSDSCFWMCLKRVILLLKELSVLRFFHTKISLR